MNTMADGARERLVAQIGEALFGQPGLTLMELAEKVRGMQPSPAGRVDALVTDPMVMAALQAVTRETLAGVGDTDSKVIGVLTAYGVDGAVHIPAMVRAMLQAALAARQPVGEPVGYLYDWTHSSALGRDEETFTAFTPDIEAARGSKGAVNIRPVYAAQPSPAGQEHALPPVREDQPLRGDEPIGEQHDARLFNRGWNACREAAAALAARQPVEPSVEEDVYCAIADMIEPYVQREGTNPDGELPASVHDSVAILLDHWTKTRQPVGQKPVGVVDDAVMTRSPRDLPGEGRYISAVRMSCELPPGTKLYAAPPAHCIDLEQFRWTVELSRQHHSQGSALNEQVIAECDRLLALIDSKAVGK